MSSSLPTTFKQLDEDYVQQIAEFVPVVNILGWTVFVQVLGNMESDTGLNCSHFRIVIQWVYFVCCVLIAAWYYIRQARAINNGESKVHFDKKVDKWKYIISHIVVSIVYLFTVQTQPIACHLQTTQQLSHLYIVQVCVVLLTTAVLKVLHAITFEKLSDNEMKERMDTTRQLNPDTDV